MGLVDELNKLSEMHKAGQLSDAEFEEAKTRMIRDFTGSGGSSGTTGGDTAGGLATSIASSPPAPEDLPPGSFQPTTTVKSGDSPPLPPTPPAAGAAPPPGGSQPGVMPGSYGARPLSTPTTTVRSGLGTGSVSIMGTGPVTQAGYTSTTTAKKPKRSLLGAFAILLIPVLFCSLMLATAGAAIFPAMARLTAPLICEEPFDHSYVEITTTPGDEAGETNINWTLQCYNDRGRIQDKGTFEPMMYLFFGFTILFFLIGAFFIIVARLRRRDGSDDVRVSPELSSDVLAGSSGPVVNPPS